MTKILLVYQDNNTPDLLMVALTHELEKRNITSPEYTCLHSHGDAITALNTESFDVVITGNVFAGKEQGFNIAASAQSAANRPLVVMYTQSDVRTNIDDGNPADIVLSASAIRYNTRLQTPNDVIAEMAKQIRFHQQMNY